MASRRTRSTIAAVGSATVLFLLLALMVASAPADADAGGNGKATGQAAGAGQSDEAHGNGAKAAAPQASPAAASTLSPQPLSNADQNPGGANNGGSCGAYCSTRDGSASGNGNGGGKAVGKPCAGCVGRADNKNPPGQRPDATDHNNGYECDGNSGIAKTNPAHTGCTTPTPPPSPECTPSAENDFCGTPSPECTPSAENDFCGTPSPTVTPSVLGVKIVKSPEVLGSRLPFTGSPLPVALLLLLGLGLLGGGLAITVAGQVHPGRHQR